MTNIREKLDTLKITLPSPSSPAATFANWVRTGNLLFLSGHIAKSDGKPLVGKLGAELTTAQGRDAARAVAIDLMGTLQSATGDLDRVRKIVKLMVLVNSAPSFIEQHLVANGASDLFVEVFGEVGRHARSAFGAASIPFGSCVEIELIAEVGQ